MFSLREPLVDRKRPTRVDRPTRATAVLLAAALCALACGCGTQSDAGAAGADHPLPTSYDVTLTSSCGERGLLGAYRVSVRDELVTGVENLDQDYPYEPRPSEVPTLQDLLDRGRSAPPDTIVEFVVDAAGVPRTLSLDPVANAIDDEECYEVTDLVSVT